MIITLAFANGFQQKVSEKVFSFWGHIRLQEAQPYTSVIAEEIPIFENDALRRSIMQSPQVASIHPFATRYAILKTKDELEGVLVKGIDASYDVNHLKDFMLQGKAPVFNDSSYSRDIMISANKASQLKVKTGDRILIYFIKPDGSMRPDKLTISGIYKTGIQEYDNTFAIGDIKLIQRLNDWDTSQIGGYEIFIKDYRNINAAAREIKSLPGFPDDWNAQSIQQITPNIFDWLGMQDVTRNVLIGIMIIVAVINLITCLIILVLERMRMAGILKAIGATNWDVQKIFLRHTIIITVTGIVTGALVGLGILWAQIKTGFIKLDEEAYYLDEAAVKISAGEVLLICGLTFLVCLLVLLIPSYIVRKIQPVKAIHFR